MTVLVMVEMWGKYVVVATVVMWVTESVSGVVDGLDFPRVLPMAYMTAASWGILMVVQLADQKAVMLVGRTAKQVIDKWALRSVDL